MSCDLSRQLSAFSLLKIQKGRFMEASILCLPRKPLLKLDSQLVLPVSLEAVGPAT
jgi:hypothetical protein